ncbi:hypothetical protein FBU30_005170 [Linnemannia zychae]|nr:hypothetical protein FBU30_005170 [Linnemannia zychae]
MINDNSSLLSPTENGNPIHQPSSDNLTYQQFSSNNFAQLIRMLGNLSSEDRKTLASALSPESDTDPRFSTKPVVKTLEPYDRLEERLTCFKHRDEFFNFAKTRELEDYADVKQFHRTNRLNSACNPMEIKDPAIINVIKTFDILRYNLAFIATEITHLRKEALYRDKKDIPPRDINDKTSLIIHQQFIDQEKFTLSLRKASGQLGRGRGRSRGGFNMDNRNEQQNYITQLDNVIKNSGNKNNDNNGSQSSNPDTLTSSTNSGNHFQQSSTTRGRGRRRGGRQ